MNTIRRLWRDRAGFVATTDLILMSSILVIGMIVGLVAFRDQVVQEFGDLATAVGRLNQSYRYSGSNDANSDGTPDDPTQCFVAGSSYTDQPDFGELPDLAGQEPAGISVQAKPSRESSGP